jgi:HSP20 family protein
MSNELTHFRPFRSALGLQDEINELFRDFFRGWDVEGAGKKTGAWAPAVDISETENEYLVRADLPGIPKKDITVSVDNGVLTLSGERKEEHTEGKGANRRTERYYGAFSRSFVLPGSVDTEKVKAAYKDGVLAVTLPKREEAKPKQINVKVE